MTTGACEEILSATARSPSWAIGKDRVGLGPKDVLWRRTVVVSLLPAALHPRVGPRFICRHHWARAGFDFEDW